MSRISRQFRSLSKAHRTALIPFITAGDPSPDMTVPMMHALVENGANVIELGVPFSDPMADGPVIQQASERALQHGTSLMEVLNIVASFREKDKITPVVLMGYVNPVEVMGYDIFAEAADRAGVDGLLLVDLPPEESAVLQEVLTGTGIDQIFLLAPTSSTERIEQICRAGSGFIYYVSVKGVTGSNRPDIEQVSEKIAEIRKKTDLPVGVGFGIKDAETAARMAGVADAVIIGSALVERIARLNHVSDEILPEISGFVAGVREAMDRPN